LYINAVSPAELVVVECEKHHEGLLGKYWEYCVKGCTSCWTIQEEQL